MNPQQHPGEALLTGYAAGHLKPAFAAAVAAHVEICAACRGQVRLLEQLGGEVLAAANGARMSDGALDRVLARLDERRSSEPGRPGPVLDRFVFGRRRYVSPGAWVRHAKRPRLDGDLLYLLHIRPGMSAVVHGHEGREVTLVLKGAYAEERGVFAAGDFVEADAGVTHRPTVHGDSECVCLIASEQRMVTSSVTGKLVQFLTEA